LAEASLAGFGLSPKEEKMAQRFVPAHAALLVMVIGLGVSGCGGSDATAPLSKQDEELMRRPVGSVPMPPEAMKAMQQGNVTAQSKAGVPQGQAGLPSQPGGVPSPPAPPPPP
jgi:hypothetical protein